MKGSISKEVSRGFSRILSYKLTFNTYKKKGYTFVGWNTKKNGKGKAFTNKESVKKLVSENGKTITLYAQWNKK